MSLAVPLEWPDAWAELQRRWLPDDPVRPDESYEAQYFHKWNAARTCKPAVIAEIGVRAGYAGLAMLLGAPPGARYIGIERDAGDFGGSRGITARAAPTVFAGFDHEIRYADSGSLRHLGDAVDLFHVDGDHSYDGCLHDMELAWQCSRWLLVDDYEFIRSVQAAVDHFIVTRRIPHPGYQVLSDGGFRGAMLIVGRRHPCWEGKKS